MGTNTAETARGPNKFREFLLWATAGTLGTWAMAQWSPAASGTLAAVLGVFVFLRVTERVIIKQIGTWRTIAIFGLAAMFATQGYLAYARQDRLATMERASPARYLDYIKRTERDAFWLAELERLDPQAFEAESRRREEARVKQEAERRAEEYAAMVEARREQRSSGRSGYPGGEWYSGGTLHHSTGMDWRGADAANQLATAADLAGAMLGEQQVIALGSIDALKPFAVELKMCIDEAVAGAEGRSLKVTELAAACGVLLEY